MGKVAYITSGKIGIPRFTYNELSELEDRGIKFILCLTQLKRGPWMPESNWNVYIAYLPLSVLSFFYLLAIRPLVVFKTIHTAFKANVISYLFISLSFFYKLRKDKITSIHCQMGDKKLYIGFFLKLFLNRPLTVTVHAHELYQRNVYHRNSLIRILYSHCDKVITISDFNASILRDQFGVPDTKISIMRLFPAIDPSNYLRDKKKILVVANWAEKKGYKTLIEAIGKINRNDFVIIVVGESYYSTNSINLPELISEADLNDKFLLMGRQGGYILELIFQSCDFFCLPSSTEYYIDGNPSEREGIPVALMEAMAWGKPVISTKHAGIPELVQSILVEENHADQLKEAIEYLLDNPQKWNEMGKINQDIVSKYYSSENVSILAETIKSLAKE